MVRSAAYLSLFLSLSLSLSFSLSLSLFLSLSLTQSYCFFATMTFCPCEKKWNIFGKSGPFSRNSGQDCSGELADQFGATSGHCPTAERSSSCCFPAVLRNQLICALRVKNKQFWNVNFPIFPVLEYPYQDTKTCKDRSKSLRSNRNWRGWRVIIGRTDQLEGHLADKHHNWQNPYALRARV